MKDNAGKAEEKNIVWSHSDLVRADRERLLDQKGCIVWFTGLSGSGKSTIAKALEKKLFEHGRLSYILDGDNIRHGLSEDLGFAIEDREENMRRIGEVALLFADAGLICITAFISPFHLFRDQVREKSADGRFVEVYLDTPIAVCEERDPKGLYKKARSGEITEFTGISSPYEAPTAAELILHNQGQSVDESVEHVLAYLDKNGLLKP